MIVSNSNTCMWMDGMVNECYNYLKLMIQTRLHFGLFTMFFIKHVLFKGFDWYIKLLQLNAIFKQRNNHQVSYGRSFCMKFLQLSIQKL